MSRTTRSTLPARTVDSGLRARVSGARVLGVLACSACSLAGCVDPKQDYDDWIARTAEARALVHVAAEAAAFDGSPPDAGFSATYFMACLPSTSQGDVGQALLSEVTLHYMGDGNGGGTVDYRAIALRKKATDLSQTVGTPTVLSGVPVANFVATVVYGPTTIPAAADPLTQIDIVFQDLILYVDIQSEGALCATLSGHVVQPQMIDLSQPGNYCVLRQSNGSIPALQLTDFHCP